MGKVKHIPCQNQRIIDYVSQHGSITQMEALCELGIMRLASRISDLKSRGYRVDSEMVTVRNRYGEKCRVKRYRISEG